MIMLEKEIQAKVITYAKSLGIQSIRMYFGPGIQTGWPDVLFLIPGGRPLFIEFKATGKKPTKKQMRKIEYLGGLGYSVLWSDNIEKAKHELDYNNFSGRKKL